MTVQFQVLKDMTDVSAGGLNLLRSGMQASEHSPEPKLMGSKNSKASKSSAIAGVSLASAPSLSQPSRERAVVTRASSRGHLERRSTWG